MKKTITYHVSVSLRDTRVIDKLVYVHCTETRFDPADYPHHEISGYALFASMPGQKGRYWDHHIGFDTDRDTVDQMAVAADNLHKAIEYRSTDDDNG